MMLYLNLLNTQQEKNEFENLYNTYKNLLFWVARQKTADNRDAEECVQETFFYIAKNFDRIKQIDSSKTKGYLCTIVTGFAIDIYNKSRKEQFLLNYKEQTDTADEFDRFKKIELFSVFDKVLNEQDKIFFYLKYLYGYTSGEIAQLYEVKDTYVRKRIQYSKEKLRKELEKE